MALRNSKMIDFSKHQSSFESKSPANQQFRKLNGKETKENVVL